MKLLFYGMGLVGERSYKTSLAVRKRITEAKEKNPEWKHYEVQDDKGKTIEQGNMIDFMTGKPAPSCACPIGYHQTFENCRGY